MSNRPTKLVWIIPDCANHEEKNRVKASVKPLLDKAVIENFVNPIDPYRLIIDRIDVGFAREIDVPVAAFELVGADRAIHSEKVMRADPVIMAPNRKMLLLAGQADLVISDEDGEKIISSLNDHFSATGIEISKLNSRAWVLFHRDSELLHTTPLFSATGSDVKMCMPRGINEKRWHSFLNEAQMVIHQCVNYEQRSSNQTTNINSIWLWGNGSLPVPHLLPKTAFIGTSFFIKGLARHYNAKFFASLSEFVGKTNEITEGSQIILVSDFCLPAVNERTRENVLDEISKDINSIQTLLKQRTVQVLEIVFDDASYTIDRHKRGWRRLLPF